MLALPAIFSAGMQHPLPRSKGQCGAGERFGASAGVGA